MPISVTHTFVTAKPDDPASDVSADEWNAAHTVTGAQDQSDRLDDIAALAVTDGNFIVGDGTNWIVESDNTARTSLGLVAGGTGDIWVEKAGDTMTDLLEIDQIGDENNANDRGIRINGFDDQSGAYWKIGISSNGRARMNSTGTFEYRINNVVVVDYTSTIIAFRPGLRSYGVMQWGQGADFSSIYQSSSDKLFFAYGNTATTDPFMVADSNGNVIFGGTTPVAQVHVDQNDSAAALPVLALNQGDIDDTFINFIGTSAANGTRSISSDTTEDSTKFGAVRVEINGVTKWVRVYDNES